MSDSILINTKKILGIAEDYTVYDFDILTFINSAFSTLTQLGVGPSVGFFITDDTDLWADTNLPNDQLAMVKTYVYLKVRYLFDPPATGYLTEAMENQIKEHEWRLNIFREIIFDEEAQLNGYDILDGGSA